MTHRHAKRRVGSLLRVEPQIRELCDLGIVGRDRHYLGAVIACLGEEMRVWCARLRHVGAPSDDIAGIVPVGALRHVGLFAPGLRGGRRQVAIPVVEGQQRAADQAEIAGAGSVGDHRHRGDRREANYAIRSPGLDGVDVGGGDDLGGFIPARAHEAAAPAYPLVACRLLLIADDRGPRLDGLQSPARFPPCLDQPAANQRVFDAAGAVEVPAIGGAARAAARLVVGDAGTGARIVGLLRLPGDDTALDVDLPAAAARAVHAVGRPHDLVVLPALPVAFLPHAVLVAQFAMAISEGLSPPRKVGQAFQKLAHAAAPFRAYWDPVAAICCIASPMTGARRTSVR